MNEGTVTQKMTYKILQYEPADETVKEIADSVCNCLKDKSPISLKVICEDYGDGKLDFSTNAYWLSDSIKQIPFHLIYLLYNWMEYLVGHQIL